MQELSKNEELILLSIWKLKDDAYGVTIRKSVMEITSKTLHYGSLYNTLDLLARKGLVVSKKSEPKAEKGGRSKILYNVTTEGKKALNYAREMQQSAWSDIPEYAFKSE